MKFQIFSIFRFQKKNNFFILPYLTKNEKNRKKKSEIIHWNRVV